jgi:hypothetical protein
LRVSAPRPAPLVPAHTTSIRHGGTLPDRSSAFTKPTEDHLKAIRGFLSSPTSLLSTIDGSASPDDLAVYNDDWMNKYHGKGPIVVKPKTTEELSKVMKYCYDNDLAVVPQGGNTGLVGELGPLSTRSYRAH